MQNKAKDAGLLTDSEDDNAVMRNSYATDVKGFYLIIVLNYFTQNAV